MESQERTDFLARVSAAVRAGSLHRDRSPRRIDASVGYLGAGAEPVNRFVEELSRVGAMPERVASPEEAKAAILRLLDRHPIRRAISDSGSTLQRLGVP